MGSHALRFKRFSGLRGIEMDTMVTSQGMVVQCIGAVVDVEFPRENMPHVYDALVLEAEAGDTLVEQGLTFEVQQQLGDGIVRTIAMGSSDGLKRGMKVRNTCLLYT